MKFAFPAQPLSCLVIVLFTLACNKTNTVNIQQPTACFLMQARNPLGGGLGQGDPIINSAVEFYNCSDTSGSVSWFWDFGDGVTSTEKNPVHRYTKRGKYTVTLIANNSGLATDTSRKEVSVISGQKEISFGENNDVYPIAIDETASGDFLLLGSSGWSNGYFLMQTDSLFQQKGQPQYLPANYRLTSMKPAGDGNYIFTGNTDSGTNDNELIKLKPDGSLIWSKTSTVADDYYESVQPSPDGGFVVVSSYPEKDQYNNPVQFSRVKKFDGNGNLQWDRSLFAERMQFAKELTFDQDAVIVAGKKRGINCSDCDSVMIVKLNNTGSLVWKTAVYGGLNATLNSMNTIKHSAGNYVVAAVNTSGLFIFSPTGVFLDRKLVYNGITAVSNTGDGQLAVLQLEGGNGFRGAVSKIKMDGTLLWHVLPNGQQPTQNGWLCCVDSWPISIQPLRNGGTLALMRRVNRSANYDYYNVISFLPLSENGTPQ